MINKREYSSLQSSHQALTIAMAVLATFFVFLRFFCRWKKGISLGAYDYVILLSMVSTELGNLKLADLTAIRYSCTVPWL